MGEAAKTPALDLEKLYQNRFDDAEKLRKARVWRVVVSQFLQRWVPRDAAVLDLGCGYGEFLNHVQCARRIGVDFNADAQRHLDPGIEFHRADVTDLRFLSDATVDVVFTSNLLEHLDDKAHVERLIREAHRVLKPGGHFIALGPNMRALHGSYWDFWDHSVAITDKSLCEVLAYLDFDVVNCIPRFLPYTTQSSLPQAPWLVALYLKFPPAWRILGGQFLIRARR